MYTFFPDYPKLSSLNPRTQPIHLSHRVLEISPLLFVLNFYPAPYKIKTFTDIFHLNILNKIRIHIPYS